MQGMTVKVLPDWIETHHPPIWSRKILYLSQGTTKYMYCIWQIDLEFEYDKQILNNFLISVFIDPYLTWGCSILTWKRKIRIWSLLVEANRTASFNAG